MAFDISVIRIKNLMFYNWKQDSPLTTSEDEKCLSLWGETTLGPCSCLIVAKTLYPSLYTTRYMINIEYHALFLILDLGLAPRSCVLLESQSQVWDKKIQCYGVYILCRNQVLWCLYLLPKSKVDTF